MGYKTKHFSDVSIYNESSFTVNRELMRFGSPGEYQLDCMVEAPNGKIYIGTAYDGLVYEMNPITGEIRNLGSPPVDSTPWIFTMICTRDGEIYGWKRESAIDGNGCKDLHSNRIEPVGKELLEGSTEMKFM
ncbi:hypothetical protein [Paenibacillus eucommiae]|uniref:Uncharacterized protein n=1 Tax=Paenibacillus eucommiae TaxID=1355755 RepID=A0ABS4IV52_9BACL|nr:hypothetical protein [Paenibacillus eucommiae]MBP1990970.1 hypothetical protein [Paenibacillus eucommiae]